jgi:hypothetical protein
VTRSSKEDEVLGHVGVNQSKVHKETKAEDQKKKLKKYKKKWQEVRGTRTGG